MRITKLEPSKHKRGRWLVWLEDGSLLRMGEGDVAARGLYAGKELGEGEVEELSSAQLRAQLKERALSLLTGRPMSKKELLSKLTAPPRRKAGQRRYGERGREEDEDPDALELRREELREAAQAVVDRLEELGLLNDQSYAATVARHYAGKGYGERRVKDELYRHGVPREYWDEALAEAVPEDNEDTLDTLLERKLRGAEPTRENLKKASDYLARRGFSWGDISDAVGRYKDRYEEESEDGEEWD